MKNHFESSRFTLVVIITTMVLFVLTCAIFKDKEIAIALGGPAFLALGSFWTLAMGSKVAEHATKHLQGK